MVDGAVPDADSLDPDRGLNSRDPVGTLLEVRGARIETRLYAFSVVLLEGRPCGPKACLLRRQGTTASLSAHRALASCKHCSKPYLQSHRHVFVPRRAACAARNGRAAAVFAHRSSGRR